MTKNLSRAAERSKPSFIALLTDFGLGDPYLGTVKAVILSIHPHARFIDVSHQVAPQQVHQAGYLLWSSYKFFPIGTLFVCIVDPGVGTERKVIAVKTQKYMFLAPDNGLLSFVLTGEKILEMRELDLARSKKFHLDVVSSTFHGRDIFAPVAAYLSKGMKMSALGPKIKAPLWPNPFVMGKSDATRPVILHIDHFGNIITNIRAEQQKALEIKTVAIGNSLVSRWVRYYEETPDRTPALIAGSSGLIEIIVKRDNAAKLLGVTIGTPISIYWA